MNRTMALLALSISLGIGSPLLAQSTVSATLYGRGVHQYFSEDFEGALASLDGAIDSGSTDPRAHYFRGLVLVALRRDQDAQAAFSQGADLEAHDSARFFLVSKALERVQGSVRLNLEKHRTEGRKRIIKLRQDEQQARYGALRAAEPEVLNAPAKVDRLQPGADPFSDDPGQSVGKPAAEPAGEGDAPVKKPAPKAEEDPAPEAAEKPEAPAKPAAPKAEEDPAAEKPEAPAKPAAEKPEAADPFADDPGAKPAKPAKPKAEDPAAEPAPEKPEAEKPADAPKSSAKPSRLFRFLTAPITDAASKAGSGIGSSIKNLAPEAPAAEVAPPEENK